MSSIHSTKSPTASVAITVHIIILIYIVCCHQHTCISFQAPRLLLSIDAYITIIPTSLVIKTHHHWGPKLFNILLDSCQVCGYNYTVPSPLSRSITANASRKRSPSGVWTNEGRSWAATACSKTSTRHLMQPSPAPAREKLVFPRQRWSGARYGCTRPERLRCAARASARYRAKKGTTAAFWLTSRRISWRRLFCCVWQTNSVVNWSDKVLLA